jgi:hypothetical protein
MTNHSKTYTAATLPTFHEAIATGTLSLNGRNYSEWVTKWPWLMKKIHSSACQCDWASQYTTIETTLHLFDAHVHGKPSVKKRLGPWSEERFLDWLKAIESSTPAKRDRISPRSKQSKANVIPPPNARSLTDGNVLKLSADMDQTVFIQDLDGKQMVIMSLADRKWKSGTQSRRFQIQDDLTDGVLTVPEFTKYLQNLNEFADLLTHGGGQA